MLVASDGLLRLVMAQLVRERLIYEGWTQDAASLAKVTGWNGREQVRYPGTSSTWTEYYVDIFWVRHGGEPECHEWRGTFAELTAALEALVEQY